jgi:hypothetical protein
MDSKLYKKGSLIAWAEQQEAQDALISEATIAGNRITVNCYGAQGREQVIFDLGSREIVKGEMRIPMASFTRFDIDHYVIEGDMKESTVFVLLISDGSQKIKLRDRVKDYYGISDTEMEKSNARVILNVHALPLICNVPHRQTYPFIPADTSKAFKRGPGPGNTGEQQPGQKADTPPGPYDTLLGGCFYLGLFAIVAAAIWLLIRRLLPFFG